MKTRGPATIWLSSWRAGDFRGQKGDLIRRRHCRVAFSPSASLQSVSSLGHIEGEVRGLFQGEPEPGHRAASQEKQLFSIGLKVEPGNVPESAEAASSTLLRGQPWGSSNSPNSLSARLCPYTLTPGWWAESSFLWSHTVLSHCTLPKP